MSGRLRWTRNWRRRIGRSVRVSQRARLGAETLEPRRLLAGEPVVISEFMASNSDTLRDSSRQYNDWVEVYNPTDESVPLADWRLTDDPADLAKWRFPAVDLAAGETIVVFASGQDQSDPEQELHTNFRLSADGDYLALVRADGSIAHSFGPDYPPQFSDVSYGLLFDGTVPQYGQVRYFVDPTPGQLNGSSALTGRSLAPIATETSGYFDSPFEVMLKASDPQATTRYTTDGTKPTSEHGTVYTQPISVSTTTTLRAVSYTPSSLPSEVKSYTYIFLDDVLRQDGAGLPNLWGYYDDQGPARPARAPANYEMDPEIVNHPDYRETIRADLRSLPTLSLMMNPADLWDFDNGIYCNPERRGDAWERPASMEWMEQTGESLVQADAGIEIHGGWARRFTYNAKFSFRLSFRAKYGATTLDVPLFGEEGQTEFQQLVLRGGFNDSWQGGDRLNTYLQDQWTRQAQRDLGGTAPRDRYVHLYLNGLYWGVYSVTERPDALWAASNRGGDAEEYDVINTGGSLIDGETEAWRDLTRLISRTPVDYDAVQQLLDIDGFIDYMIVNQYVGNWDWPHNNWFASRRRAEGEKWHFHTWDAEAAFQRGLSIDRVSLNQIQSSVGPSNIYRALMVLPEFQQRFADRVDLHLSDDGMLGPQANVDRLNALAQQIDRAIVGESARWGDGRADQVGTPLTRNASWVPRVQAINEQYFPERSDRLRAQYLNANLSSPVEPPRFDPPGGRLTAETGIRLEAEEGDILYTTDGSDPRAVGGTISPTAQRYNSIGFVSGVSPMQWWIPTGPEDAAGWQQPSFDASGWNPGTATFGFETDAVDDPLEMQRGFRVREVQSSETLQSLEDADRVLEGENVVSSQRFARIPVINFLEGGTGGFFDDNLPFPGGGRSNFVVDVTGTLLVHQAGTYTFAVSSNDGARLEIDDQILFADTERHGASDIRLVSIELTEGSHDLRLVMFERLGTAALELSYARGVKTVIDQDFLLLNDLRHHSYADLLQTDLEQPLSGQGTSAYARIPFTVADRERVERLSLRIRADDGFAAYLNGTEIARRAAPTELSFDSAATATRSDVDVLQIEEFEVAGFEQLLQDGENLLAIHALNAHADDPDMLISPRLVGHFSSQPIALTESAVVQARVYQDGVWSALARADFRLSVPATSDDLRISEVHFHPRGVDAGESEAGFTDADDFEFVEIINVSDRTVDLASVQLVQKTIGGEEEGVAFDFQGSSVRELRPGDRVLVVEDLEAFVFRYGDQLPVAGQWQGRLSNSRETLTLVVGDQLAQQFTYDDDWHPTADGEGPSLEFVGALDAALEAWNQPEHWRPGIPDGTPGRPRVERAGDANRDGRFDSSDLLMMMQAGQYEDDLVGNSSWETGDFNGDGEFDTQDIILAFVEGWYTP